MTNATSAASTTIATTNTTGSTSATVNTTGTTSAVATGRDNVLHQGINKNKEGKGWPGRTFLSINHM